MVAGRDARSRPKTKKYVDISVRQTTIRVVQKTRSCDVGARAKKKKKQPFAVCGGGTLLLVVEED